MSDSMITLQGWVGSEPVLRQTSQSVVTNFRMASTPRRFNRASGEWVDDGVTQWFTVNAWRQLGHNAKASLRKGDPVVVHGRLVARSWVSQGVETSGFEIDAVVIGHDLTKGCSLLQRNPRQVAVEPTPPPVWLGPGIDPGADAAAPPVTDSSADSVMTPEPEDPDRPESDPWSDENDRARDVSAA